MQELKFIWIWGFDFLLNFYFLLLNEFSFFKWLHLLDSNWSKWAILRNWYFKIIVKLRVFSLVLRRRSSIRRFITFLFFLYRGQSVKRFSLNMINLCYFCFSSSKWTFRSLNAIMILKEMLMNLQLIRYFE